MYDEELRGSLNQVIQERHEYLRRAEAAEADLAVAKSINGDLRAHIQRLEENSSIAVYAKSISELQHTIEDLSGAMGDKETYAAALRSQMEEVQADGDEARRQLRIERQTSSTNALEARQYQVQVVQLKRDLARIMRTQENLMMPKDPQPVTTSGDAGTYAAPGKEGLARFLAQGLDNTPFQLARLARAIEESNRIRKWRMT
jgi:chromosome segregation ATPase